MVKTIPVKFCVYVSLGVSLLSCNRINNSRFIKHNSSATGITFSNNLTYTKQLNPYTYRNFYNGGGVGIGDFNNDGLEDIFFTGNTVTNKLYLNNGSFTFNDITEKAGVASKDAWTTGVSVIDINGDNLLDIYVVKSGMPGGLNRHNELFVNQGDSTFREQSSDYGLDITGLHTHAVFFDYDLDGDLDLYLLKNSFKSISGLKMIEGQRNIVDPEGGNALYENRDGFFENITQKSGIYSSKIGFGLGAAVSDINLDGWPDLYISNDFYERDYLYLNENGKSFKEVLPRQMQSISLSSMGADIADLNHDGYPEIYVTDMLPKDYTRLKSKIHFYTWDYYQKSVRSGYHYQFARNTLQRNNRNDSFSEIGRLAGVDATDWSWAALIADFDLNGYQDIFVANGIYKDLTDQDYIMKYSDPRAVLSVMGKDTAITKLIDKMPSEPLPNYMFAGNDNFSFENKADEWNLGDPGFSNGAAYVDLDNDGDLDLVTNNVNSFAGIYENRTSSKSNNRHWIKVDLQGNGKNTSAIGAKLYVWADGKLYYREQYPARGFQSSVSHVLHVGLGDSNKIDSLWVIWPDQTKTGRYHISADTTLTFQQDKVESIAFSKSGALKESSKPLLKKITEQIQFKWAHHENGYNGFQRNPLLFHMRSTEGPAVCVADINNDNRDDFYLGGAKGQTGNLWIQTKNGSFDNVPGLAFELDKTSEDTGCAFLDIDNDGTKELYVTSGGVNFTSLSTALQDRLYQFDGENWVKDNTFSLINDDASNNVIRPNDINNDGLVDLFLGTRLIPWKIGEPVDGKILINNGDGTFSDETNTILPALNNIGMITDAQWADLNADGKDDLVVTGEWMSIKIFINRDGKLVDVSSKAGLKNTNGWWNRLIITDLNNDNAPDFVAGNHGHNSIFRASVQKPVKMFVYDFDYNGSIEQIITQYRNNKLYPVALKDNLLQQLPLLKSKIVSYAEYGQMTMYDLFDEEVLNNAIVLEAMDFSSIIGLNDGNGTFSIKKLPQSEQLAPIYGLLAIDLNADGIKELITGGNLYEVKPYAGIYDAHRGSVVQSKTKGQWESLSSQQSGLYEEGAIRHIVSLSSGNGKIIMIIKNNNQPEFYKLNN